MTNTNIYKVYISSRIIKMTINNFVKYEDFLKLREERDVQGVRNRIVRKSIDNLIPNSTFKECKGKQVEAKEEQERKAKEEQERAEDPYGYAYKTYLNSMQSLEIDPQMLIFAKIQFEGEKKRGPTTYGKPMPQGYIAEIEKTERKMGFIF